MLSRMHTYMLTHKHRYITCEHTHIHARTLTYMRTGMRAYTYTHKPHTQTMFQVTSFIMLQLPHSETHMQNAKSYLIVWWVSMVPRLVVNVRVCRVLRVSTYIFHTNVCVCVGVGG